MAALTTVYPFRGLHLGAYYSSQLTLTDQNWCRFICQGSLVTISNTYFLQFNCIYRSLSLCSSRIPAPPSPHPGNVKYTQDSNFSRFAVIPLFISKHYISICQWLLRYLDRSTWLSGLHPLAMIIGKSIGMTIYMKRQTYIYIFKQS